MVQFFSDLAERELSDLDSINDVIPYTISNVMTTWNADMVHQYIFPQIDYGQDDRPNTNDDQGNPTIEPNHWDSAYDLRNLRPSVFLKRYIDSIFKGFRYDTINEKFTQWNEDNTLLNKFTYQSDFINSSSFKKLYVPYTEEQLTKNVSGVWSAIWYGIGTIGSGDQLFAKSSYAFPNNIILDDTDNFVTGTRSVGFNDIQTNIPWLEAKDKTLKTSMTISYNLIIRGNLTGTFLTGLADLRAEKSINSNNLKYYKRIEKNNTGDVTFPIEIRVDEALMDGQYVFGIYKENGTFDANCRIEMITMGFGKENTVSKIPIQLNDNINLFDAIPKGVKLQEFLKSVMTLFNLYMVQDPKNKNNWIIEPYHTFYKDVINLNRNKAIDWTDKIDFKNYSLISNSNLPKSYTYKFAEDNDMLNDYYKNGRTNGYGNLKVNDSKGISGNKDIEVIFSPTINYNHSQDAKMLPCIFKSDGFLTGKKKPFKSKLRLMYSNGMKYLADKYPIHYRGETVIEPYHYNYTSMFDIHLISEENWLRGSILFDLPEEYYTTEYIVNDDSVTLYNRYHQQQLKELINDNLLIMEAEAYLTESDITNLDMSRPIFLQTKYGNSYFKLLEVTYTNNNTKSQIKLQKIVI